MKLSEISKRLEKVSNGHCKNPCITIDVYKNNVVITAWNGWDHNFPTIISALQFLEGKPLADEKLEDQ